MSDWLIPEGSKQITFKGLKGATSRYPPGETPPGYLYLLQNAMPFMGAIHCRPVLSLAGQPSAGGTFISGLYPPFRNAEVFWSSSGLERLMLIDRILYLKSTSGLVYSKLWAYSTGTVTKGATKSIVLGTSTQWTAGAWLASGDFIVIGSRTFSIAIVNNATTLRVYGSLSAFSGSAYHIKRTFGSSSRFVPDMTTYQNKLVMADGKRPLYAWNGTSLSLLNSTHTWKAKGVVHFRDRLWAFNTTESGVRLPKRLRWSQATDKTNFLDTYGSDTQWVDVPYSAGEILRAVPLRDSLMIYMSDAVWIGIPTNMPNLPLSFQKLPLPAGAGLVGARAVASSEEGHIAVLSSGVYWITPDGVKQLETPWKDTDFATSTNTAARMESYVAGIDASERIAYIFASSLPPAGETVAFGWGYSFSSEGWFLISFHRTATMTLAKWLTVASTSKFYLSGDSNYAGRLCVWSRAAYQDGWKSLAPDQPIVIKAGFPLLRDEEQERMLEVTQAIVRCESSPPGVSLFTLVGKIDRHTIRVLGNIRYRDFPGQAFGQADFRITGNSLYFYIQTSNPSPQSSYSLILESVSFRVHRRGARRIIKA